MTPNGLTGATGVPLAGQGNVAGTNYVAVFSGEILAGPASAMLSAKPKRFAVEQKELAADEKKWAAEPTKSAAARKRLDAEEKKLAAQLRPVKGPSGLAVDALSAVGELAARSTAVRPRVYPDRSAR